MSQALVKALETVLADGYLLLLKTQNYHWNVKGPQFHSLHLLFEEQYNDLFLANDAVAERIRTLGAAAPGSYQAFSSLSSIKEETGSVDAMSMVKNLIEDQNIIVASLTAAKKAAEEIGDDASADLAIGRIAVHEKNRWMLESTAA